jgi:phytoene dehydrogenase-like protein
VGTFVCGFGFEKPNKTAKTRLDVPDFDVIVIGAGINGLTVAAYLARAGAKVVLIERRHAVGAHCSTEELSIPGFRHNLHASALITPMGPCIQDLELEKYGLELIGGDWALLHPFQDGRAFLCHAYDANVTYKKVKRFSRNDARSFKKFVNGANRHVDAIIGHLFEPPSIQAEEEFSDLMSKIPEVPEGFKDMDGYDLVEHLFEDDQIRTAYAGFGLAISPNPRERYTGAIGVFAAITSSSGVQSPFTARGGSFNVPYSLANCVLANGGLILEGCEVEKILIRNGEAEGVRLSGTSVYPNRIIRASKAVISNLTAVPTFLHLVGKEYLDAEVTNVLRSFDYSGQTLFTVVYATDDILRWKARNWEANATDAYWFHYGAESLDQVKAHEEDRLKGQIADPIVALGGSFLFTIRDPSQAPPGLHNITTWLNVPYKLRQGGARGWESVTEELGEKTTDRLEEYSPGFKRSILAAEPYSPLDIFRRNPSAIDGNFAGGNPIVGQFYLDRPFRGCHAPRTPIKKLYISNSIWPWSGSHLATGYIAACVVAEELGIREQPWWTHKPMEWFRDWIKRESGRSWSPYVTID